MKKLVAALATGVIIAGATVSTASAEEYKVEKGDTLWSIAQEYDTTVKELKEANDLKTTVIHPKQKLFINELYKVQDGDTLYGIGQEYNVSVQDLKEWNNLQSSLITVGQELKVNGVNVGQDDAAPADVKEPSAEEADKAAASESKASETNTEENTAEAAETTKQNNNDNPEGETITVTATAYTADCEGCSGVTATGVDLNANPNKKVIAVDPNVIPLGTKVYVEGYGYATAADVGGAIQGNKIDVHVPTKSEAYDWGVRTVDVTIVE
ncbi:3D domain-containing protein [Virgibacillus ihumii]|uniref:3D domain-containing protein n=1 Tax=Virgibacillus ihumii TaxID=2686091 RepID=UPI00157D35E4|nr:3D domain-containing protein [Virgibacillus ihumii]